mmetsp:Transcript_87381/g.245306  ORF Transcript_87381/g.245306 Transcript_87381/m.245306 type:complete len:229 (+) Transcript_87381:1327-2013(+)
MVQRALPISPLHVHVRTLLYELRELRGVRAPRSAKKLVHDAVLGKPSVIHRLQSAHDVGQPTVAGHVEQVPVAVAIAHGVVRLLNAIGHKSATLVEQQRRHKWSRLFNGDEENRPACVVPHVHVDAPLHQRPRDRASALWHCAERVEPRQHAEHRVLPLHVDAVHVALRLHEVLASLDVPDRRRTEQRCLSRRWTSDARLETGFLHEELAYLRRLPKLCVSRRRQMQK